MTKDHLQQALRDAQDAPVEQSCGTCSWCRSRYLRVGERRMSTSSPGRASSRAPVSAWQTALSSPVLLVARVAPRCSTWFGLVITPVRTPPTFLVPVPRGCYTRTKTELLAFAPVFAPEFQSLLVVCFLSTSARYKTWTRGHFWGRNLDSKRHRRGPKMRWRTTKAWLRSIISARPYQPGSHTASHPSGEVKQAGSSRGTV